MSFPPTSKDNWHKKRMKTKQKFSQYTPPSGSKGPRIKVDQDEINSLRAGAPTPVIDLADSSDDRYSKRSISSSWYEEQSEPEIDNEEIVATDFGVLKDAPTGSHIVLQIEKEWDEEQENLDKDEFNELFNINLNLIEAGLETIPFYRRLDFDPSLFTNEEIKYMNDKAEKQEKNYQEVLKIFEEQQLKKIEESRVPSAAKVNSEKTSVDENCWPVASGIVSENDEDVELDELLKSTTKSVENIQIKDKNAGNENASENAEGGQSNVETSNKKEDIQEWLDGILDE